MQREAVLKTEGALLILAGAGSGKTTVLINRIANIIKFGIASESDYIPDYYGEEELKILQAGGPEAEALAALEPCPLGKLLRLPLPTRPRMFLSPDWHPCSAAKPTIYGRAPFILPAYGYSGALPTGWDTT